MDNQVLPSTQEVTPKVAVSSFIQEPTPKKSNFLNSFLIVISLILFGVLVGIFISRFFPIPPNDVTFVNTPTQMPTSTPTDIPVSITVIPQETITPKITVSPTIATTPSETPTPTQRPFADEEKLLRKTVAGFEMYIGSGNTAGALTFFTPSQTINSKAKYESIRTKNLPFTLKSWSMVVDNNDLLAVDEIKGGYRVRINECRTNATSCPILYLEMIRDEAAENLFSVDRYYDTTYSYQNNLGEQIKYQGFGL